MDSDRQREQVFKGIAASPGVAHGKVYLFLPKELDIPDDPVDESEQEAEVERFEKKLLETRQEVLKLQKEVAERLGEDEARIFDAHFLVLEDRALIEETIREMRDCGRNITYSFHKVAQRYIDAFTNMDDEYLRERANDIRDISKRLLHNLVGESHYGLSRLSDERIIVAKDVSPSDTANIEKGKVLAFITDAGSKTSHAVIMARSIQVPAVVGMRNFTRILNNGDEILVDGYDGQVVVNPSEQTLFRYGKFQEEKKSLEKKILAQIRRTTKTRDGVSIDLMANIEGANEIDRIRQYGAEGVGLFRTEYLFLNSVGFPSEEEQYQAYMTVAEAMAPDPVVIRTLDMGGDKFPNSVYRPSAETNPFLGLRAIRLCLENTDLFKTQLRAILRASKEGNVKLMYPMISGAGELDRANAILDEARNELSSNGIAFDENMKVGAMIEIPSAAITADVLARKCDFFSIGTNDLIQYLLAIDRINEQIAHLYEPTHPAVLRMIKMVIDSGHSERIRVSLCGEIAGDPVLVPIFMGLGIDELSIVSSGLPAIKYIIRNIDFTDMKRLAEDVLELDDPKEIFSLAEAFYKKNVSHLIA